ncbi:TrkA family potassium uptake protein [Candidatus Bathyarchaeota archaeon]|nr:MAG: TrkA family potassium uptake protein [Candidatus Bathyarchaeota archaeon]TMI50833.1 MAG: TrkA family potassium uptake protein [Candidatus Bathyarchaeota archaeon]TMI54895.1 MAG: TrkA family potassium uptake protein [Candidatus Bathyarchaeota archaeon]
MIIGAGRIGMHLIRYISMSDDNQLTVIEKKPERCREVSNVSDATILNEDGSKPDILKKAEASQTDLLLVATSDDRANITATRHAKKEFGVPRIISVANSPKNKQRLTEAGADIVVCPVELALRDLENLLAQDRSTTLIYRPELDLRVAETTIPLNATLIGKKIHEIKMPDKCRVALVCRDNTYVFPEPELELKSGDRVLLLGDAPSVARTVELLRSDETA